MGLTVECAQCHSHKYDPLRQKEYYELFAFFNSLSEPNIGAPLAEAQSEYQEAKAKFDLEHLPFKTALEQYDKDKLDAAIQQWEESGDFSKPTWTVLRPESIQSKKGTTLELLEDGSIYASGTHPGRQEVYTLECDTDLTGITGFRIEAMTDDRLPGDGPGRGPLGNFHVTKFDVDLTPADNSAEPTRIVLTDSKATFSEPSNPVSHAISIYPTNGWSISPKMGQSHTATFKAKEPFGFKGGTRIKVAIWQSSVGKHFYSLGRFRIAVTTQKTKEKKPLPLAGLTDQVAATIAADPSVRSSMKQDQLREYYKTVDTKRIELQKASDEHNKKAPASPYLTTKAQVIQELREQRKTRFLVRGDFLAPDYEVSAGTPAVFPGLQSRGKSPDRLDLARWLVDSRNPMTARVTVNRIWHRYFGRGIVSTIKDFGTQGAKPTHPELLDWLATSLRQSDWNLKSLHKLIVTSSTYRQSSNSRPKLDERDPLNEWLSHQNRLRVEGEIVRDAALSVSGLMEHQIGGPSVRPPQPEAIAGLGYAGQVKWETSKGADRYRRGVYTFFQRTVPYPMLITFDSPDSNVSCVRRNRSNTPLQALTLWNDPVFHECSQALGKRIVQEQTATGLSVDDGPHNLMDRRINFAFHTCLGRNPGEVDREAIMKLIDTQTHALKADVQAAKSIAGDDSMADQHAVELAVWITVGRTLLNLDEFVTRE